MVEPGPCGVRTVGDFWLDAKPGKYCEPDTATEKEYRPAFAAVLAESFKDEIIALLRADTAVEQTASRWGDEYDGPTGASDGGAGAGGYGGGGGAGGVGGGFDSDEDEVVTSSQQEQQHLKEKYYGLRINYRMLHDHCPLLAHVVVHALRHHELDNNSIGHGEIIWESFKLGAFDAQRQILKEQQILFEDDLIREYSIKHNVNIRLYDLTFCSKPNVSSIRSADVGTFIQLGICIDYFLYFTIIYY